MREILFRGKKTGFNEWVYGLISSEENTMFVLKEINRKIEWYVDADTVGQYTGLTDKNGKMIFEGDILKGKHNWRNWNTSFGDDEKDFFEQKIRGAYGKEIDKDRYFYYRNYAVEYYAPHCGFRVRNGGQFYALTQDCVHNRDLEVIGNIHDNPELLKGSENCESN